MPEIKVDDEVFELLQKYSKARMESHNSVLRLLFGLGPAKLSPDVQQTTIMFRRGLSNISTKLENLSDEKDPDINSVMENRLQYNLGYPNFMHRSIKPIDDGNEERKEYESRKAKLKESSQVRYENRSEFLPDESNKKQSIENLLPKLPHHIPTALEHTLQMIYLVTRHGLSRIDATKLLAEWHRVEIPTITIKFTRLLGISSYEVDRLLESDDLKELQTLLTENYPEHESLIQQIVISN